MGTMEIPCVHHDHVIMLIIIYIAIVIVINVIIITNNLRKGYEWRYPVHIMITSTSAVLPSLNVATFILSLCLRR